MRGRAGAVERQARAARAWSASLNPAWWYLGLALFGALLGAWVTRDGLFAGNDSATYLAVAENIRAGKGATSPFFTSIDGVSFADAVRLLGHAPLLLWPPVYPWMLAVVADLVGGSVEQAAQLIAVISFGVIAVTTGALARRLAFGSWGAAAAAAALATSYPWLVWIGGAIASDVPFLALSGCGAVLLVAFDARRDWLTLTAFASVATIACLTRFVGVGLPVAAVLTILTARDVSWRWRRWSILGAALPVLPLLGWMATRAQGVDYHAHDVNLQLPSDDLGHLATAARSWFRPEGLDAPWAWLSTLALVGLGALLVLRLALAVIDGLDRRASPPDEAAQIFGPLVDPESGRVALCLVAGYVLTLLLSAATVGKYGTLDLRITLPLMPPVIALAVAAAWRLVRRPRARPTRAGAPLRGAGVVPSALVGMFLAITIVAQVFGVPPRPDPLEDARLGKGPSDLRDATESYDLVVASSPSTFYALTGRESVPLPLPFRPSTGEPNPDFDEEMDEVRELVHQGDAIVAYMLFDAVVNPSTVPPPSEVAENLDAETLSSFDLVALIGVRGSGDQLEGTGSE